MLSLHIHSNFSLLEGTITVEEIISFAKKSGSYYASLTDTNAMNGLIRFAKLAEEEGIKPILGTLIDDPADKSRYSLFIPKNNEGYSEMCRIITSRKIKDDFSLVEVMMHTDDDLFMITPSLSLVKDLNLTNQIRKNLYMELIVTAKRKSNTRELFKYAKKNKLGVVASHPAYFLTPDDHQLQKIVSCIKQNSTIDNLSDDDSIDPEFYLMPPDEFKTTWKNLPEAIWNIEHIVQSCDVNLGIGKYKFPVFPLPKHETAFSYLWKISFQGLSERYKPITEKAVKRLQYELEVIDELGFCDYFLIVSDIVREARKRKMMNIGRGSAANSLVSYCLGFSQVDPIEQNLYFERFLNRGRTSPPDVDLDFSWRERDEIIKYVFEKYGYNRVAMISTTVTFRARSAFREVAKVFGLSNREISKHSKFIPWTSAKNLPNLPEKFPESKSLQLNAEPWKSIIKYASRLGGYPRHLSIHPSGIIITERQITDYVALEYAANKGLGLIVTQPDMYSTEDFGLIKIDLLSQRSLGVLRDTLQSIAANNPALSTNVNILPLNSK